MGQLTSAERHQKHFVRDNIERAVERIWHTQDSHGQVLALTFRRKSLKRVKLFPLGSDVRPWGVASDPAPDQKSTCLRTIKLRAFRCARLVTLPSKIWRVRDSRSPPSDVCAMGWGVGVRGLRNTPEVLRRTLILPLTWSKGS